MTAAEDQPITGTHVAKEIVNDNGVRFAFAAATVFAMTNPVGCAAAVAAFTFAVTAKALNVTKPDLSKDTLFTRLVKLTKMDELSQKEETTLRAVGMAMFAVGGFSIAMGAGFVPIIASFAFAVGNIRLASSVAEAKKKIADGTLFEGKKEENRTTKQLLRDMGKTLVSRPDLYYTIGQVGVAWMAGAMAPIIALPLLAVSFGASMKNAIRNLPEQTTCPKIWMGVAVLGMAGVSLFEAMAMPAGQTAALADKLLITVGNLVGGATLIGIDVDMTEGGAKQILANAKRATRTMLGIKPKQHLGIKHAGPQSVPEAVPVVDEASVIVPGSLKEEYQNSGQANPGQTRSGQEPEPEAKPAGSTSTLSFPTKRR